MQLNDYNLKAINDVYKNAHIAMQSISDLLADIPDNQLKSELVWQFNGYKKFIDELSKFMKENDITPKDVSFMQKAMLWSSIKMKTLTNKSRNQIAEMMIKGSVTGINELTAMANEHDNVDENVLPFITKLRDLEEEYQQRLKKFL